MNDTIPNKRCEAVLKDGTACGGYKVQGSRYCFVHSPHLREKATEARRRGGKRQWTVQLKDWEDMPLTNLEDCKKFMARGLNDLRSGRITPQILSSMASGITALVKVIDLVDMERRIDALEKKVNGR